MQLIIIYDYDEACLKNAFCLLFYFSWLRAFLPEKGPQFLGTSSDLGELIGSGELEKIKGIGHGSISRMVREFYATGKSKDFEALRKGFSDTLFDFIIGSVHGHFTMPEKEMMEIFLKERK